MRFLIKFPCRWKPDDLKRVLDDVYNKLSGKHEYLFVVVMNIDDASLNNDEIRAYLNSKENLEYFYGNYGCKVEAVNAHIDSREFDILTLLSDDLFDFRQDFDDRIAEEMMRHFPDLDGCVNFAFGKKYASTIWCFPHMGYKLYKYFGYFTNPVYKNIEGDRELADITNIMNKAVYIPELLFIHKPVRDASVIDNSRFNKADRRVLRERRAAGYPR